MIHPRDILSLKFRDLAADQIQMQLGGCWAISDADWFARRSAIPSHPCVRRLMFEMFRSDLLLVEFDPNERPTLLHGRSYLEEVQDVIRHRMHLLACIGIQSVGPGDGSHYNQHTASSDRILRFSRQVRDWLESMSPGWWGIPWGWQLGNEFEVPHLIDWYGDLWRKWALLFPGEHLVTGGMGGSGLNAYMVQRVLEPWTAFLAVHSNQVPTAELPAHYGAITRWNQPVVETEDDQMLDFRNRANVAEAAGLYLKTALDYYPFPRWWTGHEWIDTSRWGIKGTGGLVNAPHAHAFTGAAQSILGYAGPFDLPAGPTGPDPIPPPVPPAPVPPPYTLETAIEDVQEARARTVRALGFVRDRIDEGRKPRRFTEIRDTLAPARDGLAAGLGLLRDLRKKGD